MKKLALVAFVGSLLASHALYAQARPQRLVPARRPLLDAPGPGYREQIQRLVPAPMRDVSLNISPILSVRPISGRFPPPRLTERLRLAPTVSGTEGNTVSGSHPDESPETRMERIEFERRFEELKARLEKERLHPGGTKGN